VVKLELALVPTAALASRRHPGRLLKGLTEVIKCFSAAREGAALAVTEFADALMDEYLSAGTPSPLLEQNEERESALW
jgi:hypothetical protein